MVQFIKDLFRMVTGELTSNEFERLVTGETRGMYEFYRRHAASVENEPRPIVRVLKLSAYLFRAFLSKLTPARRFVYAVSLLVFLVGFNNGQFGQMLLAFVAVSFLLAMEVAEKLLTRDELALARGIQEGLHPADDVEIFGYERVTLNEVAREVGGDFLDLIPNSDHSTLAVVGDVSGKGISSALYAVKAQTAFQLFAREALDPRELLGKLNGYLYHQIKRGYFLTAAVARVYEDGRVQCCRAGHLPAMVFRGRGKKTEVLESRGLAIGMTPTSNGTWNPERGFEELTEIVEVQLEVGDMLLLYSDGLLEAEDKGGRQFGVERLTAVLETFHREPLSAIRDHLVRALHTFRDGVELKDDTTLILLRYHAGHH
jgi:sigma-B regulation protein RsbU (phosphoserine phosphatase)